MVKVNDKVILYQLLNGQIVGLYPQETLEVGDHILIHKQFNGEYLTPGLLDVNNILTATPYSGGNKNITGGPNLGGGDNIIIIPKGGFGGGGGNLGGGGGGGSLGGFNGGSAPPKDDICTIGVLPNITEGGHNGGWDSYYYLKDPIKVGLEAWHPVLYVDVVDRFSAGPCMQEWYSHGRIHFYFHFVGTDPNEWYGTDTLVPSILSIGSVTCNQDETCYSWPNSCCGTWMWREPKWIDKIWIHLRNNASFFWGASGSAKATLLRICNVQHPEYLDGVEDGNTDPLHDEGG